MKLKDMADLELVLYTRNCIKKLNDSLDEIEQRIITNPRLYRQLKKNSVEV